jgi:hypothetical protein
LPSNGKPGTPAAREKPQREFNIFFQNSLAASAAKANCDAASETLSGTRFVLSIVAQQASRN